MPCSQMACSLTLWRAGSAAEDEGTSRADLKETRPERAGLLSETSRQCCHVLVHIFYLRKKPLRRKMCTVCGSVCRVRKSVCAGGRIALIEMKGKSSA